MPPYVYGYGRPEGTATRGCSVREAHLDRCPGTGRGLSTAPTTASRKAGGGGAVGNPHRHHLKPVTPSAHADTRSTAGHGCPSMHGCAYPAGTAAARPNAALLGRRKGGDWRLPLAYRDVKHIPTMWGERRLSPRITGRGERVGTLEPYLSAVRQTRCGAAQRVQR